MYAEEYTVLVSQELGRLRMYCQLQVKWEKCELETQRLDVKNFRGRAVEQTPANPEHQAKMFPYLWLVPPCVWATAQRRLRRTRSPHKDEAVPRSRNA